MNKKKNERMEKERADTLEKKRKKFQNDYLANKINELRDSNTFIKKIRKKL
jgi:hypothetical protein